MTHYVRSSHSPTVKSYLEPREHIIKIPSEIRKKNKKEVLHRKPDFLNMIPEKVLILDIFIVEIEQSCTAAIF